VVGKVTNYLFLFVQLLFNLLLTLCTNYIVLLSELLSHLLNLIFKCFFILLVLSAKGNALVGVLLSELV